MANIEFIDYYKALGISRNATEDEIKKSYREAAKKYHSEGENPNHDKMIIISAAIDNLGNRDKKKLYDEEYDAHYRKMERQRAYHSFNQTASNRTYHNFNQDNYETKKSDVNIDDLYNSIFGNNNIKRDINPEKSLNINALQMDLSLYKINLERMEKDRDSKESKLKEQRKLAEIIINRSKEEYQRNKEKYDNKFNEDLNSIKIHMENLDKKRNILNSKKIEEEKLILNARIDNLIKEKEEKIKRAFDVWQAEVKLQEDSIHRSEKELNKILISIKELEGKIENIKKQISELNNENSYQNNIR